jgi:hypothetical protein
VRFTAAASQYPYTIERVRIQRELRRMEAEALRNG